MNSFIASHRNVCLMHFPCQWRLINVYFHSIFLFLLHFVSFCLNPYIVGLNFGFFVCLFVCLGMLYDIRFCSINKFKHNSKWWGNKLSVHFFCFVPGKHISFCHNHFFFLCLKFIYYLIIIEIFNRYLYKSIDLYRSFDRS